MSRFRVTVTILFWIPAWALFGIGFILDENGWTAAHGFTSNILAAATSGLFGLPIAAIAVQWLLRQDADSRRRRGFTRAAIRNLTEMQSAMDNHGISKVQALQLPIKSADNDLAFLGLLLQVKGSAPDSALADAIKSIEQLIEIVSQNLPNNLEEGWSFPSTLRRWEVFQETVLLAAESDGIRFIADEQYWSMSRHVKIIEKEGFERLPDLLHGMRELLERLNQVRLDDGARIDAGVYSQINGIHNTFLNLEFQIAARANLYSILTDVIQTVRKLNIY